MWSCLKLNRYMDSDHLLGLLGALSITQAVTHNPGFQAMGNWARYIHAEVEAGDKQPWNTSCWQLGWRYLSWDWRWTILETGLHSLRAMQCMDWAQTIHGLSMVQSATHMIHNLSIVINGISLGLLQELSWIISTQKIIHLSMVQENESRMKSQRVQHVSGAKLNRSENQPPPDKPY